MYCPKCSKEGITFWDWGRSFNAFRYTCPHCLEPLKANGATTKWFIGVMLWVMVVVGLCIFIQEHLKIVEERLRALLFPVFVLTVLPLVFLAWKKGGYVSRRGKCKPKEKL